MSHCICDYHTHCMSINLLIHFIEIVVVILHFEVLIFILLVKKNIFFCSITFLTRFSSSPYIICILLI